MNLKVPLIVGTISFVCWLSEVTGRKRSWICSQKCRCSKIEDTFLVDCSNAGLETVPKGLPSRTAHLNLNDNNIEVLHNDSFSQSKGGGLTNLTEVSIRSNRLKKIEMNAFWGLSSLQTLDLYDNSLKFRSSYPKSVFVPISKSLEVLDIRRNLQGDISQMDYPVSVGELVDLKELRIDCLRNKSLPLTEYGKLRNLIKISFSGWKKVGYDLLVMTCSIAVSALGITDIDFAGLNIGIIGSNTFLNLPKLKIIRFEQQ